MKKIKRILARIFWVFFLIGGLWNFIGEDKHIINWLIFLILGLIILESSNTYLSRNFNIKLTDRIKGILIIILMILFAIFNR